MDRLLKAQLRKMKEIDGGINPRCDWVLENRERMLHRIASAHTRNEARSARNNVFVEAMNLFTPHKARLFARPVLTTFLVVVVSVGGWTASVGASYNSLPGDTLYGVKLATEKTQIAVAGLVGGERKAGLLNNAAKTRAYEATALVAQNKLEHVDSTLNSLKETVAEASKNVEEVGQKNPEKATEAAAGLSDATAVIAETLSHALASAGDAVLVEKISDTQQNVTGQGIETVGRVVELVGDGQSAGDLVKKTLDNLSGNALQAVAASIELQRTLSATSTVPVAPNTTTGSTTTLTSAAAQGGAEQALKAQASLEQAKQLAESGQLSEALERAKDASIDVSNAQKTVKQVQVVVEEQKKQQEAGAAALSATSSPASIL